MLYSVLIARRLARRLARRSKFSCGAEKSAHAFYSAPKSWDKQKNLRHFYDSTIIEVSNLQGVVNVDTKNALAALNAVAQESRLAVFRLLVQAGPQGLAASKIADRLGIAPSSLSFHLKELSHAGMVWQQQEGRFVIYAANFDTMNALIGFLTENCCAGSVCTPAPLTV
jgi:ArsR family transcriptional regulator